MSAAARLDIPQGAPPSFAAKDNALEWHLMVTLDLKGWPDFDQEHLIAVRP
jgi:hypothetical protein